MGRMALIIVLGFGVTLAIMSKSITGRVTDTVENATHYYDQTRSKNIATSAAEIYLRKMRGGTAPAGSYSISSIMGGSASITITNIDKNSAAKPDTMKMTTISKYNLHYEGAAYVVAT